MSDIEQPESGQTIGIDTDSPHTVVIHCHGDAPIINIDVKHYHWPEWLDQHAIMDLIDKVRGL